jgi:hypothetical protein
LPTRHRAPISLYSGASSGYANLLEVETISLSLSRPAQIFQASPVRKAIACKYQVISLRLEPFRPAPILSNKVWHRPGYTSRRRTRWRSRSDFCVTSCRWLESALIRNHNPRKSGLTPPKLFYPDLSRPHYEDGDHPICRNPGSRADAFLSLRC